MHVLQKLLLYEEKEERVRNYPGLEETKDMTIKCNN